MQSNKLFHLVNSNRVQRNFSFPKLARYSGTTSPALISSLKLMNGRLDLKILKKATQVLDIPSEDFVEALLNDIKQTCTNIERCRK